MHSHRLPVRHLVRFNRGPAGLLLMALCLGCAAGEPAGSHPQPFALATGQGSPCGIAVDSTNVYWTNSSGTVRKVSIDGGVPTTLASGQNSPCGIAVEAAQVYWVNATTAGQVMSVPASGGNPRV